MFDTAPGGVSGHVFGGGQGDAAIMNGDYAAGASGYTQAISWLYGTKFPNVLPGRIRLDAVHQHELLARLRGCLGNVGTETPACCAVRAMGHRQHDEIDVDGDDRRGHAEWRPDADRRRGRSDVGRRADRHRRRPERRLHHRPQDRNVGRERIDLRCRQFRVAPCRDNVVVASATRDEQFGLLSRVQALRSMPAR